MFLAWGKPFNKISGEDRLQQIYLSWGMLSVLLLMH